VSEGPALELRGIVKRFGAVEALKGVDFTLEAGDIHALLGENGAGKSTLMKVAFGLARPDGGTLRVGGRLQRLPDPVAARRLGIGMVHQHFTSIPAFSGLENVALAAGWAPGRDTVRSRFHQIVQLTGFAIDPDARAEDLSAGLKQRLEVVKALATDARILLLDEPSSVLSPEEADAFLSLIKGLRQHGVSSVLITHKLGEALTVADRVTILRRGAVVYSGPVEGQSHESLAALMLGEAPPTPGDWSPPAAGELRVDVRELALPRLGSSGSGLRGASFSARAGEIVGVAAVEGNGQRELLRALAGLARPTRGSLSVMRPVSFIPEDRSSEGLIADFSLAENLALSQGRAAPWVRRGWMNWGLATERTRELITSFGVRAAGPDAPARSLSGGNQQRLIIAAALERHPRVLVAENPTRGLDLRATTEVHQRLRQAAGHGVTVIVHLSDLDELLALTPRITVLANGVLIDLPSGATREEIGHHLVGGTG